MIFRRIQTKINIFYLYYILIMDESIRQRIHDIYQYQIDRNSPQFGYGDGGALVGGARPLDDDNAARLLIQRDLSKAKRAFEKTSKILLNLQNDYEVGDHYEHLLPANKNKLLSCVEHIQTCIDEIVEMKHAVQKTSQQHRRMVKKGKGMCDNVDFGTALVGGRRHKLHSRSRSISKSRSMGRALVGGRRHKSRSMSRSRSMGRALVGGARRHKSKSRSRSRSMGRALVGGNRPRKGSMEAKRRMAAVRAFRH